MDIVKEINMKRGREYGIIIAYISFLDTFSQNLLVVRHMKDLLVGGRRQDNKMYMIFENEDMTNCVP